MRVPFERGSGLAGSLRDLPRNINVSTVSYSILTFLFSITGPIAVVLASAHQGGLTQAETASWIFGMHLIPGCLTTLFVSLYYRQPLLVVVSLPGMALVGSALTRYSINEMVGVFLVTGLVVVVLGVTGAAKRFLTFLPLPIVMGMVSGVMLSFGLGIFQPLSGDLLLPLSMIAFFFAYSSRNRLSSLFPPVLGVFILGMMIAGVRGQIHWGQVTFTWTAPLWMRPEFSLASLLEMVIPLAVTVVAIQSGQGFAILRSLGYEPPMNTMFTLAGVGSLLIAPMGCLTASPAGPVVGMFAHDQNGPKDGRYASSVLVALMFLGVALFAQTVSSFAASVPATVIVVTGGLALLPMILQSFQETFRPTSFRMGGLIAFLVTVSGVSVLGLSSAFWGLVFGIAASFFLERDDFASQRSDG